MNVQRLRPSPAMAVALLALLVAVGGTAVAANKIGTNQIKNNAITKKKIKKKAVSTNRLADKAVKEGKIAGRAITKTKIKDDAVNQYKIDDDAVKSSAIASDAVGSSEVAGDAVGGSELAADAVGNSEIAGGAVGSSEIADAAVDGAKVADDSLGSSKLSDYESFSPVFQRVVATNGANQNTARSDAPEIPLYSRGPLDLYAKCFRDVSSDQTYGAIYARTSTQFSIMDGDDDLHGGTTIFDYLNPGTNEDLRRIQEESVTGSDADFYDSRSVIGAADGTATILATGVGVKNGALFANGPYGTGNACIFEGVAFG